MDIENTLNDIKELNNIIEKQKKRKEGIMFRGLNKRATQTKQEILNRRMYLETYSYKFMYS